MSYIGTQPNNVKSNIGLYSPSQILELEKDGHWGGSLELIQSQDVSGSTTVNFTDLKENIYDTHILQFNNLSYASSGDNTAIRVSNDGGSSYESGSVYSFTMQYASSVAGFNEYRSTNTTMWQPLLLGGSGTNHACNGYVYLYNLGVSTAYSYHSSMGTTFSSATHHAQGMLFGGGVYKASEKIDAFQIFGDSSGSMTGKITLYGVKK